MWNLLINYDTRQFISYGNRFGQKNYLEEHYLSLVEFFNQNNLNYHLEIIPQGTQQE